MSALWAHVVILIQWRASAFNGSGPNTSAFKAFQKHTLFWLRFVVYRSQIQFRFLNWKFNILIFNSDFWIENSTFQFSNLAFSIQKYELKIEMLNFQFRNLNWTCNCWIFHLQIQIKFSVNCVSDLENFQQLVYLKPGRLTISATNAPWSSNWGTSSGSHGWPPYFYNKDGRWER